MTTQARPIIVQPGAGKDLDFGREGIASVMLSGEQTGGTLAVLSCIQQPDTGPPPHVHVNDDELFLVIEGQYSFYVDGRWTEVSGGGAVYFPRGAVHCYRNIGTTPGRHWILTTPSGFERFFARLANEVASPTGPDMNRIVEISREHGITYIDDAQS